ncbi:MAG: alkylation response protein AidB-like acyl-CoA dehydrogenase [Flavobacterium sp.]|jgi:alkylation response protein AidB-like acyl-CoA dehydrogenase
MSRTQEEHPFDLRLNEDQQMSRDSMQKFAQSEIESISRSADEAGEAPTDFYHKTAELGLSMMPIPEAQDGAGMPRSPLSNILNAEDLAHGDMSLAIGALTPLSFVNAVLDNGTEAQVANYLPRFVDDKFHGATIALMEPRATFDPLSLTSSAVKSGESYILNGIKSMVALGQSSELILVIVAVENEGPAAFVIKGNEEGVSFGKEEYMGLRPLQLNRMTLENVSVSEDDRLGGAGASIDLERLVDLGRIGLCAMSVGVCCAVLDYVKDYCNDRVAFDEPITNRQSVAFMIGDMATEIEAMRLMVYRAASRAEQGLSFHKEAYLMNLQCSKYAMEIGTNGVQLLGGHGFTREHPVELWYRNLRAVGLLDGCVVV